MTDIARPRESKLAGNEGPAGSGPAPSPTTPSRVYSFRFESTSASTPASVVGIDVKARDSPLKPLLYGRTKSNELKSQPDEVLSSHKPGYDSLPNNSTGAVGSPSKSSKSRNRTGRRRSKQNNNIKNNDNNNNGHKNSNYNETSVSFSTPSSHANSRENSRTRSESTSRVSSSPADSKDDTPSRVFPPVFIPTATFDPPLSPPLFISTATAPVDTTSPSAAPSPSSPKRSAFPMHITIPATGVLPLVSSPTSSPTTTVTAIAQPPSTSPLFTTPVLSPSGLSISTSTSSFVPTPTATATSIPSPTTPSLSSSSLSSPDNPSGTTNFVSSMAVTSASSPAFSTYPSAALVNSATTAPLANHVSTPLGSPTSHSAASSQQPVRMHFDSSVLFTSPSSGSPIPSDRHITPPVFLHGKAFLGPRAQSNPITFSTSSSATSTAPVCLFASLRNQMSNISPSFPTSATSPSSPTPSPTSALPSSSFSAFATLSKQQTPTSSSLQSPFTRTQYSYAPAASISQSPSPSPTNHSSSLPPPPLPLSSSASTPATFSTKPSIFSSSNWSFSSSSLAPHPVASSRSLSPQPSCPPLTTIPSPRPETATSTPGSSQRTLFFVPSSSTASTSTPSDTQTSRNVLFGPLFHSSASVSASVRASLSSLSSAFMSSPTSANASPHSKLSSSSFESASSTALPSATLVSPSSLGSRPQTPRMGSGENATAPLPSPTSLFPAGHVHFRYPTSLASTPQDTSDTKHQSPKPTSSSAATLPSTKGQRSGKLKKTLIGGRNSNSKKVEIDISGHGSSELTDSHNTIADHTDSNSIEHVSFHLRSSSGTSPRSLSSMSTFSRAALQLQQATKTSPSPTGVRSRSLSPASRNRSTSRVGDTPVESQQLQPPDVTEPWPLGPALAFPLPIMLPSESDGTFRDSSNDIEKLKIDIPKLPGRQFSTSQSDPKVLVSPRQAISSKDSRRSLPWDVNDPMICQGYLKMVPHGMFCKFRQSKRKYCALDIRSRCFFYWKNIEQRDTGRAKCLSLVVGGVASNESIEMSYAGGASTAILKCESPEDLQRWLTALDLLKSGRERSVSRTNSKFAPSSVMDSKSINTITYSSPPSRDWNSEKTDDALAHTDSIRSAFAAEFQKQQHVVKHAKKPSVSTPPPGLTSALTTRGNLL